MYVCLFPKSIDVRATYALLLRAKKERGFSTAVQFSFAITGTESKRERERDGGRKGRFLTNPDPSIFLSFLKGSN